MSEQWDLTSPISTTVDLLFYSIQRIDLNRDTETIIIQTRDNNDEVIIHEYSGSVAVTFMIQLNKTNFSINSLHKRVLQRLATDGKIGPGSVSGIPD